MSSADASSFTSFGELLKYLRRRARLTQRQLGIAVGYSDAQITRLEAGQRAPDPATVRARFIDAMDLQDDPALAQRLIDLAMAANRGAPDAPKQAPSSDAPMAAERRTNLPIQLTRFVGREPEIAEVIRLLGANRLVTLTGSGGVGKTRLALEIAAALLEDYPSGVWLFELAPIVVAALVPNAVAQVFRLAEQNNRTPTALLTRYLADKHALLLLDNCEHVIAPCAELVEALLSACLGVRVLATSREPLRVAGEVTWRVPSLATPDPAHLPPLEHLLDYEAVQLFIQHALAAHSDFELTPKNVTAVAHICHRLDGIPLAIEMAAARVRTMSLGEITTGLDDHFTLLTGGWRTAPPRQRTFRATIEWSYHLLSEAERALLARLSVFTNGFFSDAAQAVYADSSEAGSTASDLGALPSALRAPDILGPLLQLVSKSLVIAGRYNNKIDERTRYHLLETVRQFAVERLHERGEEDVIKERCANHLIQLAEQYPRQGLPTLLQKQVAWMNEMMAELGNLRALLDWSRTKPDEGALQIRLTNAFAPLWMEREHYTEGYAWYQKALSRRAANEAHVRLPLLFGLLNMMAAADLQSQVTPIAEEYLALAESVGDQSGIANALMALGVSAAVQGNFRRGLEFLERSYRIYVESGRQAGGAVIPTSLGYILVQYGDPVRGAILLEEALAYGLNTGGKHWIAMPLRGLSIADRRKARFLCERELVRQRAQGSSEYVALTLEVLGGILIDDGSYELAFAALRECYALWRDVDVRYSLSGGMCTAALSLGQDAWLQADLTAAASWLDVADHLLRDARNRCGIARVALLRGYMALAQGDVEGAKAFFIHSLEDCQTEPNWGSPLAMAALARVADAQGEHLRAARLFGAADMHSIRMMLYWVRPADRIVFDRDLALAHDRLGDPDFAAAWAEGQAMPPEQAAAYALAEQHDGRAC